MRGTSGNGARTALVVAIQRAEVFVWVAGAAIAGGEALQQD